MIRALTYMMVFFAIGWCSARYLAPWLSPMLWQPAPLPTIAGCWVIASCGALQGLALGIKHER